MSTHTASTSAKPTPGTSTSTCPSCHAALAPDQRYCLHCGHRVTEQRVDYRQALGFGPAPGTGPAPVAPVPQRDLRGAMIVLAALATVVLAVGVGIVIGRGNGSAGGSRTTVVTVAGAGTAASAGVTPTGAAASGGSGSTSVHDDWPSDSSGYTVELSSLDNSTAQSSDVTSAETAAKTKGVKAVGVLDGDQHGGTPTGKYVIYSGHFSSRKQAQAALHVLGKKFPGALILHVTPKSKSKGSSSSGATAKAPSTGASQAAAAAHKSGAAYEKASQKLPSTVGTGGSAPPTDNKKAGAGTSGACIGC